MRLKLTVTIDVDPNLDDTQLAAEFGHIMVSTLSAIPSTLDLFNGTDPITGYVTGIGVTGRVGEDEEYLVQTTEWRWLDKDGSRILVPSTSNPAFTILPPETYLPSMKVDDKDARSRSLR